jgi:hypothetical protein
MASISEMVIMTNRSKSERHEIYGVMITFVPTCVCAHAIGRNIINRKPGRNLSVAE